MSEDTAKHFPADPEKWAKTTAAIRNFAFLGGWVCGLVTGALLYRALWG